MTGDHALTPALVTPTVVMRELPSAVPEDIANFLRRYAWVILSVMALTALGAYAMLSLLTEQYDVQAELLVKIGRENLDPPAVSRNAPLTAGLRHEEVMSEVEILKAPDLVQTVVDEIGVDAFKPVQPAPTTFLGRVKAAVKSFARRIREQYHEALIALDLEKRLDDRQKAIAGLTENLIVEPVKDSDVISVILRMPDPALAGRVEESLIQTYLARRIEVRRTPGVQEFLDGLVQKRQQELIVAEAKKDEWKRKSGITSLTEQESLLLRQIRELSAAQGGADGEIASLVREVEVSQRLLASTPEYERGAEQETPNPARQSVEEKLIALKLQRSQELQKYTPESGVIAALDESIGRLNELLEQEKATQVSSVTFQVNPNRTAIEQKLHQDTVRLEGLRVMHDKQQVELAKLNGELAGLNSAEPKLTDIERIRRVAEEDYNTATKRKFDGDIASQLDKDRISNVSFAHGPSASIEPVYPRKRLVMALSFAVGLALGVGLALLLHYLDDRISRPDQVELATQIPYLGTLHRTQPA